MVRILESNRAAVVSKFSMGSSHVRVEAAERVDHGGEDRHRRGAGRKAVEEMDHVLVDHGMIVELPAELLQFGVWVGSSPLISR